MSSSHSHGCSCAEDRLKLMAPVLASINVNALPAYASRIRQQHQYANFHECSTDTIACAVLLPPLSGSYHVLFQLEFTDGLRWIIKFPATGYRGRYDAMSARALKSEALTMRLLKRDTTIPIPEVFSFDATIDNELNCPHILMEFIRGIKVSEGWFDPSSPSVSIEQFRTNVLKDVAGAMVQLNKFVYNQSGSLIFDDDGNVTGTGPAKVVDGPAWSESLREDDCNDSAFFENGPFDDPRSCFLSALERHAGPNMSRSDAKFDLGIAALLKFFINWVPFEKNAEDSGFVLKHPDLDTQNILVSETGHLCGIIDWDGVAAVPRYIGCEQYPLWLMCDWNPFQYNYDGPDPDCPQHSPEEFAYYRSMYAGFMDLCLAKEESKGSIMVQQGTASAESCSGTPSHFTRGSCLVQSLELATIHPDFKPYIIDRFFGLIEEITASEYDKSSLGDDMQNDSGSGSDSDGTDSTSVGSYDSDEEERSGMAHDGGECDAAEHQSSHEEEDSKDLSSSVSIKSAMITSDKLNHDEEDDTVAHQSHFEKEDSNDLGSSLSIESATITSDKVHHDEEDDTAAHQLSHEEGDSKDLGSSVSIKSAMIISDKLNHDEEDDTVAHQSPFEEEDSKDLGSSRSIESATITSDKVHDDEEDDTAAHQLSHEEEDSNDLGSSLSIKGATITSDKVYHDEENDTVAHQPFKDGMDDEILSPALSTTDHRSGNAQDLSSLLSESFELLEKYENITRRGVSTDAEEAAPKIDKLLGFEIVHKIKDIRDTLEKQRDPILHPITTLGGSKAKVIPSRSEQCDLHGTDEPSPESHSSEETLHEVDEYFEKCDGDDSASISSESTLRSLSGKTVRSSMSPATGLKLQPNGDSNSPSRVEVNEKFPLVDINQQEMGGVCDDVDTIAEYDQEERRAIVDNVDTSTDRIPEEKEVARDTANTSAEAVQGEEVAVDDGADTSQDINQEDKMGLWDGTDTSVTVKLDDVGEAIDKADDPDMQSKGYEDDTGSFLLWHVTHLLVEGGLDEDRMRRLKNGFLALLASLENAAGGLAVPPFICSDAGEGLNDLVAIEDSAQGHTKLDKFPEGCDSATDGEVLLEGGGFRLGEANSAGREGEVEVLL